jgi:hypothetical protein
MKAITDTVARGAALLGLVLLATGTTQASESGAGSSGAPSGRAIAQRVSAREDGDTLVQTIHMELLDRRGGRREREIRSLRRYFGGERRSVLFFESPRNVRGTAFLTYDYPEPERDDDQWLYLPAARKVRRISAADRGSYFLGTDLSYDDVKNEGKLNLSDYEFRNEGREEVGGHPCWKVEAVPRSGEIADELGYGRIRLWVDDEIWMVRRSEIWDTNGNPLKRIDFEDIREVDGVWTAHAIHAVHHKTGHQTILTSRDVRYGEDLDEGLFTERALRRGP